MSFAFSRNIGFSVALECAFQTSISIRKNINFNKVSCEEACQFAFAWYSSVNGFIVQVLSILSKSSEGKVDIGQCCWVNARGCLCCRSFLMYRLVCAAVQRGYKPERKCCGMSKGMPLVAITISNFLAHKQITPEQRFSKTKISVFSIWEAQKSKHTSCHISVQSLFPLSGIPFITGFNHIYHLIARLSH